MITLNATVKTKTFYDTNEDIDDVFPHYTERGNDITGSTFETGAARRSFSNNAPFIFLGLLGVGLMLTPLLIRHKSN